jgi:hypothetical protein
MLPRKIRRTPTTSTPAQQNWEHSKKEEGSGPRFYRWWCYIGRGSPKRARPSFPCRVRHRRKNWCLIGFQIHCRSRRTPDQSDRRHAALVDQWDSGFPRNMAEVAPILKSHGAGRGSRTPKTRRSADFESAASASSAIPAYWRKRNREHQLNRRSEALQLAAFPSRRQPRKGISTTNFAPPNFVLFMYVLAPIDKAARLAGGLVPPHFPALCLAVPRTSSTAPRSLQMSPPDCRRDQR